MGFISSVVETVLNGLNGLAGWVGIDLADTLGTKDDISAQTAAVRKILTKAQSMGEKKYNEVLKRLESLPFTSSSATKNVIQQARHNLAAQAEKISAENALRDVDIARAENFIQQAEQEASSFSKSITDTYKQTLGKAVDLAKNIEQEVK